MRNIAFEGDDLHYNQCFFLSFVSSVASQHTYNIQNDQTVKINCIYVDPTHLVTVDDDGLVKILDFSPKTPREKTSTAVPPSE